MDRVARLRIAARDLERKIYASLPWGYRIAQVFIALASAETSIFGRIIYAEFIRRGITDMPDVRGRPASDFAEEKRLADRLPSDYGQKFGQQAMGVLYRMGMTPERVTESLSDFLTDFLETHANKLRPGLKRWQAESFVLRKLVWEVKAKYRQRKREESEFKRVDLRPSKDEPDVDMLERIPDLDDPRGYHRLEQNFTGEQLQELFDYLAKTIHPDIPKYIMLAANGYDDNEIVGDVKNGRPGMLPTLKTTPRNFNENYKRHIQPAIQAYFQGKQFRKTHR